jgi:Tfp pilus assembly PilM family ATPase
MKLPNFHFFKRTFISLVITPRQIKAIKINLKKNSVVKFAQVDVPPGVVMNYRVKDKELFVKAIRTLWDKNKIRDKYVGVVVPEFSTYTKSLSLPNLTDTEINEALSWRLQDFLPASLDDFVYDWKVLRREKDKTLVQVVAVLKDVLFGYIDAVGQAGLSPLVVETPSLSVQRIVSGDSVGKLIIYVGQADSTLVISNGDEIVASSVVTAGDFNNIVSIARQMLAHYSSVTVQKVVICGVGLTQDLVQFLNYNLGRSVQFADVKLAGLLPGQVQDFLLGISLQKKIRLSPRVSLL